MAEFIADVEARYAGMSRLCIGAIRETEEGWAWEADGKVYTYAREFIHSDRPCGYEGAEAVDVSDVRMLQELEEHPEGAITGTRYYFDNSGLLSVLGVRLDPEQAARDDAGKIVNDVLVLEIDVFGTPEATDEDEAHLLGVLVGALTA